MSERSVLFSRRQIAGLSLLSGLAVLMPFEAYAAKRNAHAAAAPEPYVPHQSAFGRVSVDTSGLAERGLTNYAARIARETGPIVAEIFADRLVPGRAGAPRLIIAIETIELGNADSVDSGFFGSGAQDSISGAGLVVDASGHVLFKKPISTSLPVMRSPGDILYVENLRANNLVSTLARWVKQDV